MATGRKYGQGRGMPDPGTIEDPGMRACYDAVVENILYLLSNPFATTSPSIEVLDGDNIVVERIDQNTFRVNCNLDVATAIEDSKEEDGGILIYNQSTEDMPAGGAGEVVGTMEITDNNSVKRIIPIVDKPSADSLNPALVMFAKETIDTTKLGSGGSAYDDDLPDMVYDPDGADLAAGDAVGTADGEWHLKKANTGFLALGKQITWDDNSDRIKARPDSASSSSASVCVLCKITGGDSSAYTVDLYANGKDSASTGSGVLQVVNMHINETLAVGTWVVGHPAIVTEVEGD